MGCGASVSSQREGQNHSQQHNTGSTLLSPLSPDQHQPDVMHKQNRTESEDSGGEADTGLEKRLRALNLPEEDVRGAMGVADSWGEVRKESGHLLNVMQPAVRSRPKQFVQQLLSSMQTPALDFLALVGAARAMVDVYSQQLHILGVTHVTDALLQAAESDNLKSTRLRSVLGRESAASEAEDRRLVEAVLVVRLVREHWVDATDASAEFARRLVEAGVLPLMARDLQHLDQHFKAESDVFDESVTILHNCAKDPQLRQYYRDISAVHMLTPFLARHEKSVKLLTLLTLSYILDEEENALLLADDSDFDFLLDSVSLAWDSSAHRTPTGYSVSELLQGLGNLARNDHNKTLLMNKGALKHLLPILDTASEDEKQAAANIVWQLAFDKHNRHSMKGSEELMGLLRGLRASNHRGVAKACSGALWLLDMDQRLHAGDVALGCVSPDLPASGQGDSLPPPAPPIKNVQGRGHVMVSYQWANQKLLLQIRDSLRSHGYSVWMDVDNISGSTLQAMAEAVENASAVLVCMSQRYKDSPNCRTEAEYAYQLQKRIVPLLMERGYRADGWLGILKGAKLFFDFSGKYPFHTKMDDLVRELGHVGSHSPSQVDGPIKAEAARPVASAPGQEVRRWSQKEVKDWLSNNHLSGCSKLQGLSAENLHFLQRLSHRAPEFFFNYLKQDLGLTSLDNLMHFSDAIEKLS